MQLPLLLLGAIQESHTLIIHGWPKISAWSLRLSKSTCTKTLIKSFLLWRIRDRCNIQTCWKALLRLITRRRQSSFMKTREAYRRVKKSSSTTKSKWVETSELHAPYATLKCSTKQCAHVFTKTEFRIITNVWPIKSVSFLYLFFVLFFKTISFSVASG